MILKLIEHDFHYEAENLCRLFFPYEKIEISDETGEEYVLTQIEKGENTKYSVKAVISGEVFSDFIQCENTDEKEEKRILSVLLYNILNKATGIKPQWGILTGIHPVKTFRLLSDEIGIEEAKKFFKEKYLADDTKIELAERTLREQNEIIRDINQDYFSLYLSVPFCPSRCSYCSFVSQAVNQSRKLIPQYVELLCKELVHTGEIVKELGLKMKSVYIGGGTPTVLTADELYKVMETVKESFDFTCCEEYTVEAGRPDTITREKLEVIKKFGAKRISINPQSMNDNVLKAIGRKHSAKEILDALKMAREIGFDCINNDLIIGLPEDTPESFKNTLDTLIALSPENITVHALALKHAAEMMQDKDKDYHKNLLVSRMADYSVQALTKAGYYPYYLYRQSRMTGNLENIGWCREGNQCRYNIYTMEETQSIIACGAGAVSKFIDFESGEIKRIFNFKYSYEYVSRHDEILSRKDDLKKLWLSKRS